MMDTTAIMIIALCSMTAIIAVAASVAEYKTKARKKEAPGAPPPEPPPPFTSLSLLAGLSFFSGLGAILLATVAGILSLTLSMGEAHPMSESTRRQMELAAKIVLYASLLPAIGAAAFGLAGRGVIAESKGAVRGRPLYRTGILLALVTGVLVFNAKILNPSTWIEAIDDEAPAAPSEVNRAFLGIEFGKLDQEGCITLIRVVPGSPADRAGLKTGDVVTAIDGRPVYEYDPAHSGSGYSPGSQTHYIGAYIGSLKPGGRITLSVKRAGRTQGIVAELAASFDSLLSLVKQQSLDDERTAVLKAAGADRRYTADELRRLCAAFDLDDNRLTLIRGALPRLQDPQNAYQVLGALELPDSKTEASKWMEALRKQE